MRPKRIGALAGAALCGFVVLLITAVEIGSQGAGGPGGPPGPRECATGERRGVLRQEQAALLGRLGRLTVLRNQADLATLGRPPLNYVFLAHQFTSFRGIGLTIINPVDTPRAGHPNLIFYAPSKNAKDTTDPRGPDFPYTLVGFAYGVPYEPGRIPALIPCMGVTDWHIHERGVHPIDSGGMTPMPPSESVYGESPGTFLDAPAMEPVIGWAHPRSWTVHFWINSDGVPDSAILDPDDPPSGIDPGVGSSFYFPEQPSGGARPAAQASSARPFITKAGSGESVKVRQSKFTFVATDDQTLGAFSVIDLVLKRGSEPPAHIHHRQAEAFYLLDGEMTFVAAGQVFTAETGDFVFLPRGLMHVYRVDGDGTAHVLLFSSPPGLERYFKALAPNPTDIKVSQAYGVEPTGPPLRSGP